MKNRDDRTNAEIDSHMGRATAAYNCGMIFALDEYCCLICNAYFRKKIFQSDLQVIEDLTKFFLTVANIKNYSTLKEILQNTNNLTKNINNLVLKDDFQQVLPDSLKIKLRSLYKTKPTKDSHFHGDDDFYAKYARDLETNWLRNAQRFSGLKLLKSSKILDIGCGFGFFSHIGEFNGHKVDSIDMPNASPILKEASKLLKIKKYEFTIKKKVPLLKLNKKYDVVTAFQIFFNGHCSSELWDVEDWKFFLLDLHDNVLNDNGVIHLVFNAEHNNLKPIIVDGEQLFLGKKSLEDFFKPFFVLISGIARMENRMHAVLTKKNIKDACQTDLFKKRSFTIEASVSKYGF